MHDDEDENSKNEHVKKNIGIYSLTPYSAITVFITGLCSITTQSSLVKLYRHNRTLRADKHLAPFDLERLSSCVISCPPVSWRPWRTCSAFACSPTNKEDRSSHNDLTCKPSDSCYLCSTTDSCRTAYQTPFQIHR